MRFSFFVFEYSIHLAFCSVLRVPILAMSIDHIADAIQP